MLVSVIIATHNRPEGIAAAVASLRAQTIEDTGYEIIVVDDGSSPRVPAMPSCTIVRLEGVERSAARNAGAAAARGEHLIFIDDDMIVGRDFISLHLTAQREWPGSLVIGRISLDPSMTATPFGRFREKLESSGIPTTRGPVASRNFCAANVSISRQRFQQLGGFHPAFVSAEDQDLAMRHTAAGGAIVYLPEAEAIHHDSASTARSYCRRNEWGYENLFGFVLRYPSFADNIDRVRINGPLRLGKEPLRLSIAKVAKTIAALAPMRELLFLAVKVLEIVAPRSRVLVRLYTIALGVAIRRGFMRGWRRQHSGAPSILVANA